MHYQVTVRYGGGHQRYHTLSIEAEDAVTALQQTAGAIPPEIAPDVDLVELRIAANPETRAYLDEDAGA